MSEDDTREIGMKVRRRILGDEHVDAAIANTTSLTREFQDMLVRFGWGEVWARPGFDYRTRRLLVLGTMIAIGRWEEFRMHLKAALKDDMSLDDLKELMLQQAIYCGLPAVNTAFHHVHEVFDELRTEGFEIDDT